VHAEADVLPHVQVRKQRVILKEIREAPRLRPLVDAARAVEERIAVQRDLAFVGAQQARDRLQRQALARARRPEQHDALRARGERHVERELALGRVQGFTDVDGERHVSGKSSASVAARAGPPAAGSRRR
jgi:hypothetical protein